MQIVHSSRKGARSIEHIGSAHDDAELAALEEQLAEPEHATDASLFQRYSSLKKEQETTLERWAELSLELEEA